MILPAHYVKHHVHTNFVLYTAGKKKQGRNGGALHYRHGGANHTKEVLHVKHPVSWPPRHLLQVKSIKPKFQGVASPELASLKNSF